MKREEGVTEKGREMGERLERVTGRDEDRSR
jgi:hypothetical protein